jgi:hypothetical protein
VKAVGSEDDELKLVVAVVVVVVEEEIGVPEPNSAIIL